jgi:O-antigen ligase
LTQITAQPASETALTRAALYITWACVVSVLFSIAVSQILLGLALVAMLASGTRARLPRIWLPLALFMAGTLISLALSGAPLAGLPQIRKFYVYLTLLVVYSVFRKLVDVRRLTLAWAAVGSLAASVALVQFLRSIETARKLGESFYDYYINRRITGFMSHWQTFGGETMIVLLMLAAFLLFSPRARGLVLWLGLLGAGLMGAAVLLNYTRGVWLATACAGIYLLWCRKRWLLSAIPVLLLLLLWINPGRVRSRFESGFEPRKIDSNQHRIVCWRTGWAMIRAHPWFGVGPEMVGPKLMQYVPWEYRRPDKPEPLPEGWYGHLHNFYIHYAAERGVPTMLALVWLLGMALWDFLRALRRLPDGPGEEKSILHGAVAVVAAIMIAGIFEVNLGDSEVLALFLTVVACGYVAVGHVVAKEPSRA